MKRIMFCFVAIIAVLCLVSCDLDAGKTYNVTYDANGGEGSVPESETVQKRDGILAPCHGSLSKKGYDFAGWNTKQNGKGTWYKEYDEVIPKSDMTLYAQWSLIEYEILYNFSGTYPEGVSNPRKYTIETETFVLNNPEREGYEFLGWKVSLDGKPNKRCSVNKGTTGDLYFYDEWRELKSYSISYDSNGGVGSKISYAYEGNSIEIADSSDVSWRGYEFVCWNTESDGSGTDYKPGELYEKDEDLKLYAKWNVIKYAISYDLAGGTLPEGKSNPTEYTVETDSFVLVNPTKDGYEFVGWKDSELSDDTASRTFMIRWGSSGDMLLTALWKPLDMYTITFDANGADRGSAPESLFVYEGTIIEIPKHGSLSNEWHVFFEWNTDSNGHGDRYKEAESIVVESDMTLYAIWKEETLSFSYLSGSDSYSVKCIDKSVSSIVIPSEYKGKSVTLIDSRAFFDCSELREITISSSVIAIGSGAFSGCEELSVVFSEGWTKIPNYALNGASGVVSVSIPSSVIAIGALAFNDCSGLTSITIPEGVTEIGSSAFSGCSGLTSITIPEGVTEIGSSAFSGCSGLTSITIPEGVTKIGNFAFSGCSGLDSITIPSSVTSIGEYAFEKCNGLNVVFGNGMSRVPSKALYGASGVVSVTIPLSVSVIGQSAFAGCSGLVEIIVPEGVEVIGIYAFKDCTDLTKITLPSSVMEIQGYAFSGCSGLSVVFSEGIEVIPWRAFEGSTGIVSIVIPSSTRLIDSYAFYGCRELESITIPEGVTGIGISTFSGCSSLTSIAIPEGVTEIGTSAFNGCSSLSNITIPASVTVIGNNAFLDCSGLEAIDVEAGNSVYYSDGNCLIQKGSRGSKIVVLGCKNSVIPEGVTEIESFAFLGCSGLESITIPSSVKAIRERAFAGCSGLETIEVEAGNSMYYSEENCLIVRKNKNLIFGCKNSVIPKDVAKICAFAFYKCDDLENITIPEGVTNIDESAFSGCSGLKSITIPESVTYISSYVFSGCRGLTSINYSGTKMQWNSIGKGSYWNSNTGSYIIHCTDGDIAKN